MSYLRLLGYYLAIAISHRIVMIALSSSSVVMSDYDIMDKTIKITIEISE